MKTTTTTTQPSTATTNDHGDVGRRKGKMTYCSKTSFLLPCVFSTFHLTGIVGAGCCPLGGGPAVARHEDPGRDSSLRAVNAIISQNQITGQRPGMVNFGLYHLKEWLPNFFYIEDGMLAKQPSFQTVSYPVVVDMQ